MTSSAGAGIKLSRRRNPSQQRLRGFELQVSQTRASEPDLLPMINIIFLLLVVFMLLGRIERAAPVAVSPPASDVVLRGHSQAELLIPDAGDVVLNGEVLDLASLQPRLLAYRLVRVQAGEGSSLQKDKAGATLTAADETASRNDPGTADTAHVAGAGASLAKNTDANTDAVARVLRIRADRSVSMQRLADLLVIIRDAGFEKIEIETVAAAAMP